MVSVQKAAKLILLALAILVEIAIHPASVLACACCTDRGQRSIGSRTIDEYYRNPLRGLKFASTVSLHLTPAGFEGVAGIANPSETYSVSVKTEDRAWTFDFRNPKGYAGKITFALPNKVDVFEVDPRDVPDEGNGPLLYKEWRLFSKLVGDGMFAKASGSLTLILHGRGLSCPDEGQFHHWTLVARGPGTAFTLLGQLETRP